jgi:oxygen-independent coproporphyrinogen-3 oxidase
VADLERWRTDIEAGQRALMDRVELTPRVLVEDSLIFGLRMNEGVSLAALRARFPEALWEKVDALAERLTQEGLAVAGDGRLRLTLRGRLVADAVGGEIMGAFG